MNCVQEQLNTCITLRNTENFSNTNFSLYLKGTWNKNHTSNLMAFSLSLLLQGGWSIKSVNRYLKKSVNRIKKKREQIFKKTTSIQSKYFELLKKGAL